MPDNCRQWQELLAEQVLNSGASGSEAEMTGELAEHLAVCRDCRATLAEFRSTTSALAHADSPHGRPAAATTPDGLTDRITTRLGGVQHRRDGRRRSILALATAAAAMVIVVSVVVVRNSGTTDPSGERVALSAAGVHVEAVLQARPWGTQIHLDGAGFTPGQQYYVWLEQADGTHIPAGTFTGVRNAQITVVLASAVPSSEAVAIGVSEPDGDLVVRASLD